MYIGHEESLLAHVEPAAHKFILHNDRALYFPYFEAVERFCSERKLIIGGEPAMCIYLGRPYDRRSFLWEIYSGGDTYKVAMEITELLASVKNNHIPSRTAAMSTNIKYKDFTVSVNARRLFYVKAISAYRGVDISSLWKTLTAEAYLTHVPLRIMPAELMFIHIYRTLYSPAKAGNWEENLFFEHTLFHRLGGSYTNIRRERTGGTLEESPLDDDSAPQDQHGQINPLGIVYLFKGRSVVVGDLAISHRLGIPLAGHPRVSMICALPPEAMLAEIRAKYESKKCVVTMTRNALNIPSDFQIMKYGVTITSGKHTAQMDIYNSAEFEIIPYAVSAGGVFVGNPWVLLRFIFVEIWNLGIIAATTGSDFSGRIDKLCVNADMLRKSAYDTFVESFQVSHYYGSQTNEDVAKKKMIRDLGERFRTYYPAKQG